MATSTKGQKQDRGVKGKLQFEQGNNRITLYDTESGVYRLLIGEAPNGSIVIAISKEGEDVIDALSE